MMLKRKRISAIMIMVLIFSQISVESFGADVSDKLLDLSVTVEQGGDDIEENDWDTINTEENINLSFSFRVPVQGDGIYDASEVVNYNDSASFELAKGFTLNSGVGPFELNFGGKEVGTLTVVSDEVNKTVTANITFDGDEDIFSGNEWSNVGITFNANISYDRTGNDVDGGEYTVFFLDKAFDITVPSLPVEVTGEKTGV